MLNDFRLKNNLAAAIYISFNIQLDSINFYQFLKITKGLLSYLAFDCFKVCVVGGRFEVECNHINKNKKSQQNDTFFESEHFVYRNKLIDDKLVNKIRPSCKISSAYVCVCVCVYNLSDRALLRFIIELVIPKKHNFLNNISCSFHLYIYIYIYIYIFN